MELREFFTQHPRVALAFSGGVDSSYLLYAARQWAEKVGVYYVRSAFQPEFEVRDALRLAEELGSDVRLLRADVLGCDAVTANPADRCYHCKQVIMSTIRAAAAEDGYTLVIDGTNASDEISDRPGFRALEEQGILSPLRICGLSKAEIRRLSREVGLFTWNKPAYACLATRIPTGERITAEKLAAVEAGESALAAMGFTDFRLRSPEGRAWLQFTAEQLPVARARFDEICAALAPHFSAIAIDPKEREKSV